MTSNEDYTPPESETPKPEQPEAEPSAIPPGYVPQPYPKAVYHPDGRTKTVQNELDEDTAEGDGFTLDAPPAPEPHKDEATTEK